MLLTLSLMIIYDIWHVSASAKQLSYIPATTVSARWRRTNTCSMSPTSVHACKLRTLFRRIAMNTLHISAWKEKNQTKKESVKLKTPRCGWKSRVEKRNHVTCFKIVVSQSIHFIHVGDSFRNSTTKRTAFERKFIALFKKTLLSTTFLHLFFLFFCWINALNSAKRGEMRSTCLTHTLTVSPFEWAY